LGRDAGEEQIIVASVEKNQGRTFLGGGTVGEWKIDKDNRAGFEVGHDYSLS